MVHPTAKRLAKFPWNYLKAETLRSVCRDLGGKPARVDSMVAFLTAVEVHGLEQALEYLEEQTQAQANVTTNRTASSSTPKRDREPVVSDYNTRHRDKRVRVSDPGPGRRRTVRMSRKPEVGVPRTSVTLRRKSTNLKSAMKKATHSVEKVVPREVFIGVVLSKSYLGKRKASASPENENENASMDDFEGVGLPSEDHSSLASSNKENEIVSERGTSDNEGPSEPGPASDSRSGARSALRVTEGMTNPMTEAADEDIDAEGEVVADHEDVSVEQENIVVSASEETPVEKREVITERVEAMMEEEVRNVDEPLSEPEGFDSLTAQAIPNPDVAHLTQEEVNDLDQFLKTVVENGHSF